MAADAAAENPYGRGSGGSKRETPVKPVKSKKKAKEKKYDRREMLDVAKKEQMIATICRNPEVYVRTRDVMKRVDLRELDIAWAMTWLGCEEWWLRHGGSLPTRQQLVTEVQQLIAAGHGQVNNIQIESIDNFIRTIFADELWEEDLRTSKGYADFAIQTFARWQEEQAVWRLQGELIISNTMPADPVKSLQEVLEEVAEVEAALGGGVRHRTFAQLLGDNDVLLDQCTDREMLGLRTGMEQFDRHTLGLRGLFVYGAPPGTGKTSFALEAALGVCRFFEENDAVALLLSLEMDLDDLVTSVRCNLGRINYRTLTRGSPPEEREPGEKYSADDAARVRRAAQRIEAYQLEKRLHLYGREELRRADARRIAGLVADAKKAAGASRALIVIDYAQLLPVPEALEEASEVRADKYRVALLRDVLDAGKNIGSPFGDAVFAISEVRKPPSAKEAWGESLSELAGSVRLSYTPTGVLLTRDMDDKEVAGTYGVARQDAHRRRQALIQAGVRPVVFMLRKARLGMNQGWWGSEFIYRQHRFVDKELFEAAAEHARRVDPARAGSADDDDDEEGGCPPAGSNGVARERG
jgi:hypothetical protein